MKKGLLPLFHLWFAYQLDGFFVCCGVGGGVMFLREFFLAFRLIFKSNILWVALGIVVFVLSAMVMASLFSGRQPATVALDVGLSVVRLLFPLFIVFLVQELFSREFERRYCLSTLTYPRSRILFLLSRFSAVFLCVLILLLFIALLLVQVVKAIGAGYQQSSPVALNGYFFLVNAFLMLDFLFVISLAVFLAVYASVSSFVLVGVFGLVIIGRSYSSILHLLDGDSSLVVGVEEYSLGLNILRYCLPDLGALDVRAISLYGQIQFLPNDWFWLVVTCLVYSLVMISSAVWLFNKKRFS